MVSMTVITVTHGVWRLAFCFPPDEAAFSTDKKYVPIVWPTSIIPIVYELSTVRFTSFTPWGLTCTNV
jgi:hypothetical protein